MKVFQTISECRIARAALGKLALVPTMGALHAGHLSLIRAARDRATHVAVSIFVNPTQFGPKEDFAKYPRPLDSDLEKCRELNVDLVFNPAVEQMYPPGQPTALIDLPQLTEVLEGKHRPGHFKGVCQIVGKLLNILTPQAALFGLKDYQQYRVITAMAQALDWPVEIVGCPTIRERDGLAMSSRNQYLSPDERARALAISRALMLAQGEFQTGITQTNRLIATMQNTLLDAGTLGRVPVSIDYIAAVDPMSLKPVESVTGPTLLAIAARVGKTRLIDNMIIGK